MLFWSVHRYFNILQGITPKTWSCLWTFSPGQMSMMFRFWNRTCAAARGASTAMAKIHSASSCKKGCCLYTLYLHVSLFAECSSAWSFTVFLPSSMWTMGCQGLELPCAVIKSIFIFIWLGCLSILIYLHAVVLHPLDYFLTDSDLIRC